MIKAVAFAEKILICIPYWAGDNGQASLLAKLLADLSPGHSNLADILFVRRFDAQPMNADVMKHVTRKFNVLQHRSTRREIGWPQGCNGLFFGALEYIYHMSVAGKIPAYKAIFNCASDVVPLVPDWLEYLHQQWRFLPANLKHPVYTAGALIAGEHPHINGDAMLYSGDPKFLKWLAKDVGGIKQRAGWDWVLAGQFQHWGWANIPNVYSLWQTPSMGRAEAENWRAQGAVIIHGVKDNSLLEHARKMML
jgi:hypothetical protein